MTEELKNRIESIINKSFNYKGKNVIINKYKHVSGTIVLFIDNSPKNFLISEMDQFFENLHPPLDKNIGPGEIAVPNASLSVFNPTKENETVKMTLLETLKKVKESADYIPQANAVCNVVNQIVNVQKTEIQMLQILSKK